MNRAFRRIYYRMLALIAGVALLSAIVLYTALYTVFDRLSIDIGKTLFHHPVTHMVFIVALISYVFLSVGLMNAVILFSLSQPQLTIRAIWPALLTNLVVGFVFSRWMTGLERIKGFEGFVNTGHGYAILGLFVGSIVFMVLSIKNTVKVLNNLDYYLYADS